MTSADQNPDVVWLAADVGLLAPSRVGTRVEAATGDAAFLQAMLDAEAALVRAQVRIGRAPVSAAAAVTEAARAERFDVRGIALRARGGGNPVIPLVADLKAAVSVEAAPYVHQGATSQDIMDSAFMLVASRCVALVFDDLRRAVEALGRLAAAYQDTSMAGRTLTQHAVPTTFGLKAAGWRSLVLDGADRLVALHLPVQLGGAAGTLAAFEVPAGVSGSGSGSGLDLVEAYAEELGLVAPQLPWHTLRTPIADLAAALAVTVGAMGKIAADVLVLGRTEIGEVAEGDAGGSSAMPHKANPVRATVIAAAARQVPGLAAVLFGALAAEDERPAGAWHTEWQTLRELLRLAGGAAETAVGLVENLSVFPDRMLQNLQLTRGLVVSERLAAELGDLIGREPARTMLTEAAHQAVRDGRSLEEVLAEVPGLQGRISRDQLRRLADPVDYLGAASALVDRALERTLPTFSDGSGR
ncbi:3-carboxy-cis,cis-muconate cycloisomerase [Catenulispora rubra]|uniref:3-carboxy-cis,cis-muconate cycloisomerase n=1 Tax=Catenulispora rubra TaxID=280293 RepID=UPI001E65CC91|nr:3-carboxy-cis,cis-muconate cycloisomerase [Catenulispora rubra]